MSYLGRQQINNTSIITGAEFYTETLNFTFQAIDIANISCKIGLEGEKKQGLHTVFWRHAQGGVRVIFTQFGFSWTQKNM